MCAVVGVQTKVYIIACNTAISYYYENTSEMLAVLNVFFFSKYFLVLNFELKKVHSFKHNLDTKTFKFVQITA